MVLVPWTGRTYVGWDPKVVPSPTLVKPDHGPARLVAVAYFAWLGLQPVAPEVSRKYTLPRLNTAGASRCWPGHGLPTRLSIPR